MRILFVCSGNAHRSPLAEALLKKTRPDLEVDSAGLHVAIPISEEVRDYLRKLDAEQYLKKAPESLGSKRLSEYDCIVAMGQRHRDGFSLCALNVKEKYPSGILKIHTSWNMMMLRGFTGKLKTKSENWLSHCRLARLK